MADPRFKITVNHRGGLSSSQRDIFQVAAARWERVIVKPLPPVKVLGKVTRGLVIDAQGENIDGGGGILGQAGPLWLRPATAAQGKAAYLPSFGIMSFDSADLAKMEQNGTLLDVILHEMGHVLGIGTVWRRKGFLAGAQTINPRFTGLKCRHHFHNVGGIGNAVPVENSGGGGTRDSHWLERHFRNELMTGYVSAPGVVNPLSVMTIGSLEDLGYDVDYQAADAYTIRPALMTEAPLTLRPHCEPLRAAFAGVE